MIRRASLVVVASLLGIGCRVAGEFHCETNAQCVGQGGENGACVTGSCAFGDTGCVSGWRYDESAAETIAGTCVGDTPPADCATWVPRHFAACAIPAPLGAIRISGDGYVYDTDLGEFLGGPTLPHTSIVTAQSDGTTVRIISAMGFTLDPQVRLRVIGSLPLIIASWSDLTIAGRIDAGSSIGSVLGPGANFAGCKVPTSGEAGVATGGSGGGGGGGFAGLGGDGGAADRDNGPGRIGGTGGATIAMPTAIVHGGCPGAAGAPIGPSAVAPLIPSSAASAGAGGGAIQLTARTKLVVSGVVEAAGAGGGGGLGQEAGAGGGGSGGFIGLEAPMLSVTGVVAANGGAGGAGAISNAMPATAGGDGNASGTAAAGGNGAQCASSGAAGSAGATLTGASVDKQALTTCGGGGGGGGAGAISIRSAAPTMTGATVSPPAVIDPS